MKTLQVAAALAAIIGGNAIATTADAGEWYAAARVGVSEAEVSGMAFNEGLTYGGAVGTSVGPVRVEAGVTRLSGDFANVIEADALDYSLSGFLDFPVGDRAALFVGGGVDYVDGSASIYGSEIEASGNGYHYTTGLSYRFSPGIIGEAAYSHLTAELDADYLGDIDLESDQVSLGLRLAL